MGVVRRRLLRARPTSPCKLLCRGSSPLRDQGCSAESPQSFPCPAPSHPGDTSVPQNPRASVPSASPTRGRTPLTFGGLQPLGARGLEAAQGPLDHLLVLDLHHLGRVRLVVLGARREDLPGPAAGHLRGCRRHPPILGHPHCPARQSPASWGLTQTGTSTRAPQSQDPPTPLHKRPSQHCQEMPRKDLSLSDPWNPQTPPQHRYSQTPPKPP